MPKLRYALPISGFLVLLCCQEAARPQMPDVVRPLQRGEVAPTDGPSLSDFLRERGLLEDVLRIADYLALDLDVRVLDVRPGRGSREGTCDIRTADHASLHFDERQRRIIAFLSPHVIDDTPLTPESQIPLSDIAVVVQEFLHAASGDAAVVVEQLEPQRFGESLRYSWGAMLPYQGIPSDAGVWVTVSAVTGKILAFRHDRLIKPKSMEVVVSQEEAVRLARKGLPGGGCASGGQWTPIYVEKRIVYPGNHYTKWPWQKYKRDYTQMRLAWVIAFESMLVHVDCETGELLEFSASR